jgi:hypothetical protein
MYYVNMALEAAGGGSASSADAGISLVQPDHDPGIILEVSLVANIRNDIFFKDDRTAMGLHPGDGSIDIIDLD